MGYRLSGRVPIWNSMKSPSHDSNVLTKGQHLINFREYSMKFRLAHQGGSQAMIVQQNSK
jgi:hypothetical protein